MKPNGEKLDRTARFIDEYHVEIGGGTGSNLYHSVSLPSAWSISEMRLSAAILPPEKCFVYVESTDEIGIVERGEMGYWPAGVVPDKGVSKRQGVEYLNNAQGVHQSAGDRHESRSLCGWATKAADLPTTMTRELQKQKHRDRGDAR
jgi:hypothetical protein